MAVYDPTSSLPDFPVPGKKHCSSCMISSDVAGMLCAGNRVIYAMRFLLGVHRSAEQGGLEQLSARPVVVVELIVGLEP